MNLDNLLPGLLPASFRGIAFDVPDTRTEVGRRVAEHLFPGLDRAAYDDMGRLPDRVTIDGLLIGDDYIAQARRLQAAFTRAGPGTLMHPWLGGMTVIMDESAGISFSARELRVARFNAVFKRVGAGGGIATLSTVARLLTAATGLGQTALSLVSSPGLLTISQARGSATVRSARIVTDAWSTFVPAQRFDEAAPAISSPIRFTGATATALITSLPSSPPGAPEELAKLADALSAALLGSVPAASSESAVSPAADALAATSGLSAVDGARAGLFVAGQILLAIADAPSPADAAMLLGAAGAVMATVATLTARIDFTSREEAATFRAAITDSLDTFADIAATLSETIFAAPASLARRSASALRAAVIADINEAVGRLPEVVSIETSRPVDAFLVATHIYGDTPGVLEAGYLSIVSRNRHRHPAMLPAGRVEALR